MSDVHDRSGEHGWTALLGRRDVPTDGVEDYCTFLGQALARRGITLENVRVAWDEEGWAAALKRLDCNSADWRGRWTILQYTALSWSRRGFPFRALSVLRRLRRSEVRVAVMFHEPSRQTESPRGLIDRMRGACQDWVIRRLYDGAQRCIFTDVLKKVDWLPDSDVKSIFAPIGANIPEATSSPDLAVEQADRLKTVAVFGVTDRPGPEREREVTDIAHAVRAAVDSGVQVRVLFIGRGTAKARETISLNFRRVAAETVIAGLLSADEVSRKLAASDVALFVRGRIQTRRGSVMAAIACGLPIVGYAGMAEGTPLADAGLEMVPYGDRDALGGALTRVLKDASLRSDLHRRSVCAQRKHFSWDTIAATFVGALNAEVGVAGDRT